MDKEFLLFNLGFLVTGAAAIYHVSTWAQDAVSENFSRWHSNNYVLSVLAEHEIRRGICPRRWLDPLQSDVESRSDFQQPSNHNNLDTKAVEAMQQIKATDFPCQFIGKSM